MADFITKSWLSTELQKVHSVVIYVNPLVSGVTAPKSLLSKPSFTLLLSHHFDRPLVFRKDDLKSDFLFENGFETCLIPWESIWAAHPENSPETIVFWNMHSPGEGWDVALCNHLGVKPPQSGAKPEKSKKKKSQSLPLPAEQLENLPEELAEGLVALAEALDQKTENPKKAPKLKLEKAGGSNNLALATPKPNKNEDPSLKSTSRSRSHLKLVK